MLVGEAPGREEFLQSRPFVGKSGQEQERHLNRHGLSDRTMYKTNVVKEYRDKNPDPTREQIEYWAPRLLKETEEVRPRLIVAVGRFAMRWFLGESAELDACHGLPHRAGAFDKTRTNRAPADCCVLPIYHVAAGFYDGELRALIAWDYSQVAAMVKLVQAGKPIPYRVDHYEGKELYYDVTGTQLVNELDLRLGRPFVSYSVVGLDTEGYPDDPWSIQISTAPGSGLVLRTSQPDFHVGILHLQHLADSGCTFVTHDANTPQGALYDTIMCRAMGLELSRARLYNTMYMSYLLRLEPKGLKPLAYRHEAMRLDNYYGLVEDKGREKQVEYLTRVLERTWYKPIPRTIFENDGTSRLYTPQSIERAATSILRDVLTEKQNKDGELCDPYARWKKVDPVLRRTVEKELGKMPIGTLNDLPLDLATTYAGKDADATRRLYFTLRARLESEGRWHLAEHASLFLPVIEEMQRNGMPASRPHFENLSVYFWDRMCEVQSRISTNYFDGRPFNPKSPKQVKTLLRRLGLTDQALKTTDSGDISTNEKSIGHLKHTEPAISDIFEWRHYQQLRSMFCESLLESMGEPVPGQDIYTVHTVFKPASIPTRRVISQDPNLQQMPTRTEEGRKIRAGFVVSHPEVFGSWDQSQIEARILAHVSRDPLLIKFFNEGQDIHVETAKLVLGDYKGQKDDPYGVTYDMDEAEALEAIHAHRKHASPAEIIISTLQDAADYLSTLRKRVDKERRDAAKTINYGIIYGMSAHALQIQLAMRGIHWSQRQCEKALDNWFKTYVGVRNYTRQVERDLDRDGYVDDIWGMRRYLPGIWSDDRGTRNEAIRQAVSFCVSGGAQGTFQNSIIWLAPYIRELQDAGYNVKWRQQVYDEIILSFDVDLWEVIDPLVVEALTMHHGVKGITVPVEADGKWASSWDQLK